jgi:hypothetical protein
MKTKLMTKKNLRILMIVAFSFIIHLSWGQSPVLPTYLLTSKNVKLSSTAFEFDIYLKNTSTIPFPYASGQYFLDFDNSILTQGIATTVELTSVLPAGLQPVNPKLLQSNGVYYIGMASNLPNQALNYSIPAGTTVLLLHVKVRATTGSFFTYATPNATWRTTGNLTQLAVWAPCVSAPTSICATVLDPKLNQYTSINPPRYCAATSSAGPYYNYYWIAGVQVNGTINTSGEGGYSNFTSTTFSADAGSSVTIKLIPGKLFSDPYPAYTWKVWIDYNHDYDFTDAGEEVLSVAGTQDAVTRNITLPAGTVTTRMRVALSFEGTVTPCQTTYYGEYEDYSFKITPAGGYCPAWANRCDVFFVHGVNVNGTTHTSEGNLYSDFTGTTFNATAGSAMSLTLTPYASFPLQYPTLHWKVWIDYNGDHDFTDIGEEVLSESTYETPITRSVTLPAVAISSTRMRVAVTFQDPLYPCGAVYSGEYEDYTIKIAPALKSVSTDGPEVSGAENVATKLNIYPNPAKDNFIIAYKNFENAIVTISDIKGQVLNRFVLNDINTTVDISNYVSGMYFVSIINKNMECTYNKIIKQ